MSAVLNIATLKTLAGITDDSEADAGAIALRDENLQFICDYVEEIVLNHCHIKAFPQGLTHTGYMMALDLLKYGGIGQETAVMSATTVKEGDASVSYGKTAPDNFETSILKQYKAKLNAYRKLVW